MKKHKGMKIATVIGIVVLLLGAILFGAGLAYGGSLRYLSVNKQTVSWWPFSHGSIGIGNGEFQNENDDDYFGGSWNRYQGDLGDIKVVDIKVDMGDVEIKRGSQNVIKYQVKDDKYITINNINGNLSIDINHDLFKNNSFASVVLELKDKDYDKISIQNKLGDIDVEGIHAKAMDIDLDLGDIDMEAIYSESFLLNQQCGDIDISGTLLGKSEIYNKLGSTDVLIQGDEESYQYSIHNTLGDTNVLGNDHVGRANVQGGYKTAKNSIKIEDKLGDIKFDIR